MSKNIRRNMFSRMLLFDWNVNYNSNFLKSNILLAMHAALEILPIAPAHTITRNNSLSFAPVNNPQETALFGSVQVNPIGMWCMLAIFLEFEILPKLAFSLKQNRLFFIMIYSDRCDTSRKLWRMYICAYRGWYTVPYTITWEWPLFIICFGSYLRQ